MTAFDAAELAMYLLGTLPPDEARALEAELSRDAQLRAELDATREALGTFAYGAEAATPSPELRARVLASTDAKSRFEGLVGRVAALFDVAEDKARALLAAIDAPSSFKATPVPMTFLFDVEGGPGVAAFDAGIVKHEVGLTFPRHRHLGEEVMLLLEGSIRDDAGKVWVAGDTLRSAAGSAHSFEVLPGPHAVVAVLLEKGIELEGSGAVLNKGSV